MSVITVGLLNLLDISVNVQFGVCLVSVFACSSSYLILFETRSSSVQQNIFKISSKRIKIAYHLLYFLFNCSFLTLLLFSSADQETTKLESLKNYPCPTELFFDPRVFIVSSDQNIVKLYINILGPIYLSNAVGQIVFHSTCTVYYLYFVPTENLSMQTKKLQRQFFVGTVLQTVIPLIFLALPLAIFVVIYTIKCSCQSYVNVAFLIVELHGIAASITILSVYPSYRKAIGKMLLRVLSGRLNSTIQVSVSPRNNGNSSSQVMNRGPILEANICTLFNFVLTTLITPYIFIQNMSAITVGLLNLFDIPIKIQGVLGLVSVFVCSSSYLILFEGRSSSLQRNVFRISKTITRNVYHSSYFAINCSYLTFILFLSDEQEAAKLETLKSFPCPTERIAILLFNAVGQLIFHSACSVYYLYIVPTKNLSLRTKRLQRQFFIGTVLQTGIPLLFLALPLAILVVIYLSNCSCQGFTNMAILIAELHGIAASITILSVYTSYRKTIRNMILGFLSGKLNSTVQITVSPRINGMNSSQVVPNRLNLI
ncbi:hypothetical protein CAEBREN_20358 [Caenorhabditis brenneri]|uniref:Uncharacterized protein n=1 Tax=Caenorhabditis brenneri TaxID=135651 RepID=G0NMY3_CAEBE|nr:hypothetical protein CAEBREN_20358 [Caenorhabditis brenneri]